MGLNYRAVSQADALNRWPMLDARIERTDDCWRWAGHVSSYGYGRVQINGKLVMAHRAVYTALIGPIPSDMTIDHLCRNRACVNPAHLEVVTLGTNIARRDNTNIGIRNREKTHCPQGHPYDAANTRAYRGGRYCRACQGRFA